jgi:hypothetical protein
MGTAAGGGPFGAVLEFNFSLRSHAAVQFKDCSLLESSGRIPAHSEMRVVEV